MKKNVWIMNHYAGNIISDKGGRHYNFAKFLKLSGYEPVVFCSNSRHNAKGFFYDNPELWHVHQAEEIDVPVVYVASREYVGNGKQRVLNMVDFYRNIKKTAKEYAKKAGKPDVIFASSVHPLTMVAGIQLAKHFGVKCICEVRDLWPESIVVYSSRLTRDNPVIKLLYLGEKWIYKKADAIVFTMEGAYDYIRDRGWEQDIPREKVHYINNGVDLEQFLKNKTEYVSADSDLDSAEHFNVVYTGSIRKVNNLGILLDSAKIIDDPKIRFLIWGGGDELPRLRQRVKDENISNVIFKGIVEKQYVPYIVSKADLNIAHCEATPIDCYGISFNKIFDYMAAGKPILSDFPSPYNPAVQSGSGTGVDQPTPENIAAAVLAYAEMDDMEYKKYTENAEAAAKIYDFKELTKRLIHIIEAS